MPEKTVEELYIRENFKNFDVITFLKKHTLEDYYLAKKLFSTAIDNILESTRYTPLTALRDWALTVQKNDYYPINSTVALEYFLEARKKRFKLSRDLGITLE